MKSNYEKQYRDLLLNTLNGEIVENPRTGAKCFTSLNYTFKLKPEEFPVLTVRKVPWKSAIKEMMCYMRSYQDLNDFHSLGVKTWDANCNAWYSIHKQDENDCGLIYGASATAVGVSYPDIIKTLQDPVKRYDRGIIWNFWNPAYFEMGCLRPCMMMHHFTVLGETLHLTSYQRSMDIPLGGAFNLIQAWFLLVATAKVTGLKPGTITLHVTNCHVYENQLDGVYELLGRELPDQSDNDSYGHTLKISETLNLEDLLFDIDNGNFDDFFRLENYQPKSPIKFPFTV